jgi:hypothetical protein
MVVYKRLNKSYYGIPGLPAGGVGISGSPGVNAGVFNFAQS